MYFNQVNKKHNLGRFLKAKGRYNCNKYIILNMIMLNMHCFNGEHFLMSSGKDIKSRRNNTKLFAMDNNLSE